MSARVIDRSPAPGTATAAIVVAAVTILAARPFVGASPGARTGLFALAYAAIGLASLAVPAVRNGSGMPPLPPVVALVAGLGAVAVATIVTGPAVPAPFGSAALALSLLAAVAEEALFRRAAYGRLVRFGPAVAVVVSALLFGLVHLPAYGVTALPVDLGAGLLFGWQRWASGTWAVPAATHAAANLVAVLR